MWKTEEGMFEKNSSVCFRSFEETYLVRVEELPNVASFSVNILSVLKATDTSFSFHLLHFNFAGPWMPTLILKRQILGPRGPAT